MKADDENEVWEVSGGVYVCEDDTTSLPMDAFSKWPGLVEVYVNIVCSSSLYQGFEGRVLRNSKS